MASRSMHPSGLSSRRLTVHASGAERLSSLGYATPLLSTVLLLATGAPAAGTTFLGVGLVLGCGLLSYDRCANRPSQRSSTPDWTEQERKV